MKLSSFVSSEPETAPLPGEWDNACNELQRMLIVRSLRPDRVAFCATSFIVNNLGSKFTEPPVLDMQQVSITRSQFEGSREKKNYAFAANLFVSNLFKKLKELSVYGIAGSLATVATIVDIFIAAEFLKVLYIAMDIMISKMYYENNARISIVVSQRIT